MNAIFTPPANRNLTVIIASSILVAFAGCSQKPADISYPLYMCSRTSPAAGIVVVAFGPARRIQILKS